MGALPRPDVPAGARRDLADALHQLHHRAGWPSLRALSREAGCSHTTVATAFSSPKLPRWGILEVLVEAMGGDTGEFRELWLAASAPAGGAAGETAPLAGRRRELTIAQRHVENGRGLLLVHGEAGMGKTRLVSSVVDRTRPARRVSIGHCLPLSSSVPLFPVVSVLRQMYDADPYGVEKVVQTSAPYVATSLARLLPDLADTEPGPDDAWSRHHLFLAITTLLDRLEAEHPSALVLEDLHWADTATLDLLEHLLAIPGPVPVLGTWRTEDPTVAAVNVDWWTRVRRMPHVSALPLELLTREETRKQLQLLTGKDPTEEHLDLVHSRSCGLPLFTEQLADHHPEQGTELPPFLADVLDTRLGEMEGAGWAVARTLGVAERPLDHTDLSSVTELTEPALSTALHELGRLNLLAAGGPGRAQLRHPLMADAIRRRLVPGEAEAVHLRLALTLATHSRRDSAEIASHWQGANQPTQELTWRIIAAGEAEQRLAAREAFDQWLAVVDLWPNSATAVADPPITLAAVYIHAIIVAEQVADVDAGHRLVDEALSVPATDAERIDILRLAGNFHAEVGDRALGAALLDEAVELLSSVAPSPAHVTTLRTRAYKRYFRGQLTDAVADVQRAFDIAEELGDPSSCRSTRMDLAWLTAMDGRYGEGRELARQAWQIALPHEDPLQDLSMADTESDLLLQAGAGGAEVAAAGEPGLAVAAHWQDDTFAASSLRYTICQAYLRGGEVAAAAAVVDPVTDREVRLGAWAEQLARATLDVRRGRLADALERFAQIEALPVPSAGQLVVPLDHADAEIWAGLPGPAASRLRDALEQLLPTGYVRGAAAALSSLARAHADLASASAATSAQRAETAERLQSLLHTADVDPFGLSAAGVDVPAHSSTWDAELARLCGTVTANHWVAAVEHWDRLARPHASAYCRWRAAEAATRAGERTVAAKLLARAARDARTHVPLSTAVAGTAPS